MGKYSFVLSIRTDWLDQTKHVAIDFLDTILDDAIAKNPESEKLVSGLLMLALKKLVLSVEKP